MDINLTDSVPVQRKYTAIPRPLYAEIKQYVEDLLNRGWIQKSRSAYSSPVVCVRKKDGSLRLCVDYRQLNSKHFRDYLYHVSDFIFYADNNPLNYVLTTAKLHATGHRWVSELADFSFTIKYRPGHSNKDADALSRLPMDILI